MNLLDYVQSYRNDGLKLDRARVKVCQEILMRKLMKSNFKDNITFKGGIIMYQLSKELRRSTLDVDIDFVKLSINKENIIKVFNEIGKANDYDDFSFSVITNRIEPLKHEAYKGKRIILKFQDKEENTLNLKVDIGVHKHANIIQEKLVFDIKEEAGLIELFCNPTEQMIVEKSSSFIRFGELSTRIKDIFDLYFLIKNQDPSKDEVKKIIDTLFIKDKQLSSIEEYIQVINQVFNSELIKSKLSASTNWLDVECE